MTRDELIKDLDACIEGAKYGPYEWGFVALRAIAELHKPELHQNDNLEGCVQCSSFSYRYVEYPCPTIRAIEKELK
jgi:hypothetical protein